PPAGPGYAVGAPWRRELRLDLPGQFDGGLNAGERDERSLVNRPDGLQAFGHKQRQQAFLAGQEERAQVTDTSTTGAEPAGRASQRGLHHGQLTLVDLRQPPLDDEQARRCPASAHGPEGLPRTASLTHLLFATP